MPLAVRVIPVVLYRGEEVVKGVGFDSSRSVGHVRQAIRLYNARGVDEVVALDVTATPEGRGPNFDLIRDLANDMYSPLAVGGGVSTLEHFRLALENGADKVVVNTAMRCDPALILDAARKFGSQSVVVSIDSDERRSAIVTRCGRTPHYNTHPREWAAKAERLGAGEIIINSVYRDGSMIGYDVELIRQVSSAVSIPVVACGGAGKMADFKMALEAGAHAVAASAIFCFTDTTPRDVVMYLKSEGYPVRVP